MRTMSFEVVSVALSAVVLDVLFVCDEEVPEDTDAVED